MIEVLLVLIMTGLSTSLLGVFLVLRKSGMATDAISHTILLGIVVVFFLTGDLRSPLLIVGATFVGILTVYLIEVVTASKMMRQDAAIGLVFTALFAVAVILVSRYARNVHLDIDAVLLGQVLYAPLHRIDLFGMSLPYAFVQLSIIFMINVFFVVIFYKELKISSFDPVYATLAGFSAMIVYYVLMTLVSVTAVAAFDAVGSILVISFFIAPAATSYLIVNRSLFKMIVLSLVISVINSVIGCYIGFYLDISISGAVASISTATFFIVYIGTRILKAYNHKNYMKKKTRAYNS